MALLDLEPVVSFGWYYTGETVDGLMDMYADFVKQVG